MDGLLLQNHLFATFIRRKSITYKKKCALEQCRRRGTKPYPLENKLGQIRAKFGHNLDKVINKFD